MTGSKDIHSLQAIAEWAAFHQAGQLLKDSLELIDAAGAEVSPRVTQLIELSGAVLAAESFKYNEEIEDEYSTVESSDQLDILESWLEHMEKNFSEHIVNEKLIKVKRLCVIQRLLRHLSRTLCEGRIPEKSEDFTVNVKTFDFSECKEALLKLFETHGHLYVDQQGEHNQDTYEMDQKLFVEDLSKSSASKALLYVPILLERFQTYSIPLFRQAVREFVEDVVHKIHHTPTLNVAYQDQQEDALLSLAEGEDWPMTKRLSHGPYADAPRSSRKSLSRLQPPSSSSSSSSSNPAREISTQEVINEIRRARDRIEKSSSQRDPIKQIEESAKDKKKRTESQPSSSSSTVAELLTTPTPKKAVTASEAAAAIVAAVGADVASTYSASDDEKDEREERNEREEASRGLQLLKAASEEVLQAVVTTKDTLPQQLGTPARKKARKGDEGEAGAKRKRWTQEEEEALVKGIHDHGVGNWQEILEDPEFSYALRHRTNVNLKDKYRNLAKKGLHGFNSAQTSSKKRKANDESDIEDSDSDA